MQIHESGGDPAPPVVQSLIRGLSVIRAFDAAHSAMTLADVARRTELPRATVRRVLHTLASIGYVRSDGKQFALQPRVLELGYSYLSSLGLPEIVTPHLEKLTVAVNESSSVSLLDDTEIVYVARVATHRIMTVTITVGTRFPAHLTSMGRVLLAGLPQSELAALMGRLDLSPRTRYTITDQHELLTELAQIAKQGWAVVDQELEEGLRSMAVPLRHRSGRVIAAINISTSTRRGSSEAIRAELLPYLINTAREIEQDLFAVYRR